MQELNALKARKRAGESYSDVILRVTGEEEKSVCDFLQGVEPSVREEVAKAAKSGKADLDRVRPRKVPL